MGSKCESCSMRNNCSGSCEKPETNKKNKIKKVIAIMSGKGGVGKSSVTGLIAVHLNRLGYKVGIMDADITGPTIPRIFGLKNERAFVNENEIYPVPTNRGIKIISLNLLMEQEDTPVIWRGPVIANIVKQFWTDVIWEELDCMLVDMPPGTSDVPLTVMQSLPLTGTVMVTTPQDLVSMIVRKAVNMSKTMNVPVLGLIENMSYIKCPQCGKIIHIFGKGRGDKAAKEMNIDYLGDMSIDLNFVQMCDEGKIEEYPEINRDFGEIVRILKEKVQ